MDNIHRIYICICRQDKIHVRINALYTIVKDEFTLGNRIFVVY